MRRFLVSLPERIVRSLVALAGGAVHETAQLLLPRLVRTSRLYEATAKNLLRVTIELVGRVEGSPTVEATPPKELAVRKGAGNVVELGSIAAFGFSPLWLLAGAYEALPHVHARQANLARRRGRLAEREAGEPLTLPGRVCTPLRPGRLLPMSRLW